jgi:putative transposase
LIDYLNEAGNVSKKWKILRLFNQSFKIRWSRDLPSFPKTLTIQLKNNKYYISFVTELSFRKTKFSKNNGEIKNLNDKDFKKLKSAGLDINLGSLNLGNKKFHKIFKTSNNKNSIKKVLKKKKLLERKQSKRVLKSLASSKKNKTEFELPKTFNKTQDKINNLNDKITNKRDFNLHQLINEVITYLKDNKINHLVIEDLDVKSMISKENINSFLGKSKTKSMRKNILDISFGRMINIIRYKCAMNNIYLSSVDPKNTSKMCSNKKCNNIKDLNLLDRIYNCEECGLNIDRDYNSALNIEQKGMR